MAHVVISLWVAGSPVAQGSLRRAGGRGLRYANDATLRPWREQVGAAARAEVQQLVTGPVMVDVEFALPRPAGQWSVRGLRRPSAPAHPTGRPDVDKLLRSILDALTSVVYADDAQVVTVLARKTYVDTPDAQPGVLIRVTEL
jgi:crossover junction endodeoxyribonuclease RusA